MKILHLISGGDTGGAKTHIESLFQGFALREDIDTKIICFIEDSFYYDLKEKSINIEVFEQRSRGDMTVVKRLREEIIREDYDIIHCHGARANFIALFLRSKIDKPFITTVHSDYELDFKDNFYKKLIFTRLNKLALKKFDYYIAVSDSFKDMLVARGFKEENIYVVYNGIDLDEKRKFVSREEFLSKLGIDGTNKTIVGIMARLDQVKDHRTFLDGAKYALEKNKDLLFLIAGDGQDREDLEAYSRQLGLEDKVYFLGHIADNYSFLNTIDINTLTSVSESFPYAVLEGAAMKKTIISTRVGGLTRLIEDGKTGYLIDVKDSKSLGEKIDFLARNQELREDLGENLYEKVSRKYSSRQMAKKHFDIYRSVLSWKR